MALFSSTDNARAQLDAGISAATTSIPLKSGEGALFPQPYNGTASSTGDSQTLNDTGDLGNLAVGDIVKNITDGSWCRVTVAGTNSVTTTRLQGGTDNTWESGDEWQVNEFIITATQENASGSVTAKEKIRIKGRSTDTLTARTRGYDGSTAQSFDADDYINLMIVSKHQEGNEEAIGDLANALNNLQNILASTSTNEGASLIGVEDSASYFSSTTVEGVLAELQVSINNFSTVPAGSITAYAGSSTPSGWILCDGSAISRTTYSNLFSAISTSYGSGDGSTTFNVPDLRGRVTLGKDDMGGSSANVVTNASADSLGGTLGSETHTLIEAELPAHKHNYSGTSYKEGVTVSSGTGATVIGQQTGSGDSIRTDAAGSDTAHNNMQPSLTVNYIIKT